MMFGFDHEVLYLPLMLAVALAFMVGCMAGSCWTRREEREKETERAVLRRAAERVGGAR